MKKKPDKFDVTGHRHVSSPGERRSNTKKSGGKACEREGEREGDRQADRAICGETNWSGGGRPHVIAHEVKEEVKGEDK